MTTASISAGWTWEIHLHKLPNEPVYVFHVHVWGPGYDYNTPDAPGKEIVHGFPPESQYRYISSARLNRSFHTGDRICAEGWYYNRATGYYPEGRPCLTIKG